MTDTIYKIFQSTPPVKAATRDKVSSPTLSTISIHAAREGGDHLCNNVKHLVNISIHAAREGGDFTAGVNGTAIQTFQSTPPVKAATRPPHFVYCRNKFQSTPPVKAATLMLA